MKKILIFGAGSDLICELINTISLANNDVSITFISSSLSTKRKFKFLQCKNNFIHINYKNNFEKQLSKILKNQKFDDIYIPNGYLPTANSLAEIRKSLFINYFIPYRIINSIIKYHKNQHVRVVSFSSPASDRPRKSNFVYGSHKAMLDFAIEGLRMLYPNITFVIVKPGPTETKMTKNLLGFKHNKIKVAKSLYWQLHLGMRNIYAPFYWKLIMIIIKLIPNKIFRFLNL